MKKIIGLILVSLFLSSCNKSNNKPVALFDYIEISYHSSWSSGFSISVDSNFILKKCDYKFDSTNNNYYCDSLASTECDSINFFIKKIYNEKFNEEYLSNCVDCGMTYIIIKCKSREIKFKTDSHGTDNLNLYITSLINYLYRISKNAKKVDSKFYFNLTLNEVLPPALQKGTSIKFITPQNNSGN